MHEDIFSKFTVNLSALAKNYKIILNNLSDHTECASVVKSNAYGLGTERIVKKLSSLGCSKFFVENLDEGIKLRSLSLTDEIYVLNGIYSLQEEFFYLHNLVPFINSIEQATIWNNYALRKRKRLPAVINIDTGMHVFGINIDELESLFKNNLLSDLRILYVVTDSVIAENCDPSFNENQYNQIQKFMQFIGDIPISICNSSNVFLDKKYHFDLVRIGSAIYGLKQSQNTPFLYKVVEFSSTITQIKEVKKGETIGKDNNFIATRDMKIATVPLGYANGIFGNLGGKGYCAVADIKVPIISNVDINHFVIDVTDVIPSEIYVGAEVEIIGNNISIDDIAKYSNRTNIEVLINLASRHKKHYLE